MEEDGLKHAIESIVFASESPLTAVQIREAFEKEITESAIREKLEVLKDEYKTMGRGFLLYEMAGGYQFVTDPRYSVFLKRFYQERDKKRLTQAALETLSVIAYKQPVTRADIEFIRGVNVDGPIKTLLERNLVKIVGRKDVPGRPMMYGTTKEFLNYLGLNSINDLPPLPEYGLKDIEPHLLPPELKAGANDANSPSSAPGDPPQGGNEAVPFDKQGQAANDETLSVKENQGEVS